MSINLDKRSTCENCEKIKTSTKLYITRDSVTDQYIGTAEVCDDCTEAYEELNDVTLSLE